MYLHSAGSVVLNCNTTLQSPLTSDLIDVARNLVLSQLRAVRHCRVYMKSLPCTPAASHISLQDATLCTVQAGYDVDGLIVGLNFPNGFVNSEPSNTPFMTTFFDSDLLLSGPDILPFGAERQSLLLSTLLDIIQKQSQPISTIDIIAIEQLANAPPPSGPPPPPGGSGAQLDHSRCVRVCCPRLHCATRRLSVVYSA